MNISIILAAGEGTRMKSKLSKVLHKVSGKPILQYVIEASKGAKIEKNIVIVGHSGDQVREYFSDSDIDFRSQPIGQGVPYGTGYAAIQALDAIEDDSTVLILYGDTPLITRGTIEKLLGFHNENKLDATVLTAILPYPKGYGRIIRSLDGSVEKIVEEKDASEDEKAINEINSGIYSFKGNLLKLALNNLDNNNAQNEYYITDAIEILRDKGYNVGGYIIDDPNEIHGVNSRSQLAFSESIMRDRIMKYHMDNGVTIINPGSTVIGPDVTIGRDTIIYPGALLEGQTILGEDCIIRGDTRIIDSKIGNGVVIESSTIENSRVGENTKIGPYAHLRPNCSIGRDIKIGNFVEVKNSTMDDFTKAGHLAYIGDADIGKNVNIGCGVIFVNYDGKNKHRSLVEDNAFIGSNANLVAPVRVEPWGYIAAGSTITKDVKEGELSLSRSPQTNIDGWVERKGLKNKK